MNPDHPDYVVSSSAFIDSLEPPDDFDHGPFDEDSDAGPNIPSDSDCLPVELHAPAPAPTVPSNPNADPEIGATTRSGMLLKATEKSYNVYRRKFAQFLGLDPFELNKFIPRQYLTDANFAAFFRRSGEENEYKPYVLKAMKAALQSDFVPYGLSSFSVSSEWPLATLEFKKWSTQNKEIPYFAQSASPLSSEAVSFIFKKRFDDLDEDLLLKQKKAYLAWGVFAAMRNKDIHSLLSKDVSKLPASKGVPRRFRGVLASTKNDPQGTGAIENREFFIPCTCAEQSGKQKRSFLVRLKNKPDMDCDFPTCPYGAIADYLVHCPSPYGMAGKDLHFMRSKTNKGPVQFTTGNLGINQLSKIMVELNELLPSDLRGNRVTGHSARHTAASIAINNGCDSSSVAKVTHHKDPRALAIYAKENDQTRLSTALAIGSAISRTSDENAEDGDDEAIREEDFFPLSQKRCHIDLGDDQKRWKEQKKGTEMPTFNFYFK